jgi:hypothetical protein
MTFNRPRSVVRFALFAVAGLLAVVLLMSCGRSTTSVAGRTTTPPSGGVRLGCRTYCQSAGGLAGTLGPGRDAVTINSSGTLRLDANNYVPVSATCNLPMQCVGSLVIQGVSEEDPYALGRSDLQLNAGATMTFEVQLPGQLAAYIRAQAPPCAAKAKPHDCPVRIFLIADTGPSLGCDGKAETSTGGPVLGLPWCGQKTINGFRAVSVGNAIVVPG